MLFMYHCKEICIKDVFLSSLKSYWLTLEETIIRRMVINNKWQMTCSHNYLREDNIDLALKILQCIFTEFQVKLKHLAIVNKILCSDLLSHQLHPLPLVIPLFTPPFTTLLFVKQTKPVLATGLCVGFPPWWPAHPTSFFSISPRIFLNVTFQRGLIQSTWYKNNFPLLSSCPDIPSCFILKLNIYH